MEIFNYLTYEINKAIESSDYKKNEITEIRLRKNSTVCLTVKGQMKFIKSNIITQENLDNLLFIFCKQSIPAFEDEISNGYITLDSGHRIGLGGDFYFNEKNKRYILKELTSLNIRIAKDNNFFQNQDKLFFDIKSSILIAGAPHSGKTSLAKEYAKQLSKKYRVVVCDERNEISYSLQNCDVIKGVNKALSISMATRTLNPEIIICDEIGLLNETVEILSAINTGVKFICTAHGENFFEISKRPNINTLIKNNAFEKIVFLKQNNGKFYIKDIKNV